MIQNKHIPVKNIYYMLSYAFQVLREIGYKSLATENYENVADLCAAILVKALKIQIKRGLTCDYIEKNEALSTIRGRIDLTDSIRTNSMVKHQLICNYDEFSINSYMNRIIRTTLDVLLKSNIQMTSKNELRRISLCLAEIDPLDVHTINWNIQYNRNNQTYQMIISICYLVIKGLLQTQENGSMRLMDYLDEQQMHKLYEKFILKYYAKEFPSIKVSASQIQWALDDDFANMLPIMQSDIMLSKGNTILIIDAKYYTHTTQTQYDMHTLHSGNLYQIFTYVKNKDAEFGIAPHAVSGMLLYAATDEEVLPDNTYKMSGNKICVKTLDLNKDFSEIANQLNNIVAEHFNCC